MAVPKKKNKVGRQPGMGDYEVVKCEYAQNIRAYYAFATSNYLGDSLVIRYKEITGDLII